MEVFLLMIGMVDGNGMEVELWMSYFLGFRY